MSNPTNSEPAKYTTVAVVLHWLMALLIISNLMLGFVMKAQSRPTREIAISLHVSIGLTVLIMVILRVGWRLFHLPPPHPPAMETSERRAATLVHFALYLAMVLMPLTGWALLSANPPPGSPGAASVKAAKRAAIPPGPKRDEEARRPPRAEPKIWWIFPRPTLTPLQQLGATPEGVKPQKILHDQIVSWHSAGAFIVIALLLLHVTGALKHQIIDRRPELERMTLKRKRSAEPAPVAGIADWPAP